MNNILSFFQIFAKPTIDDLKLDKKFIKIGDMIIPIGMLTQDKIGFRSFKAGINYSHDYRWPEENGFPTVLYDILIDGRVISHNIGHFLCDKKWLEKQLRLNVFKTFYLLVNVQNVCIMHEKKKKKINVYFTFIKRFILRLINVFLRLIIVYFTFSKLFFTFNKRFILRLINVLFYF